MSSKSKREYLEAIYFRYKKASRGQKALILDEFCATCGYHRKHAIRLLTGKAHNDRKPSKPGERRYSRRTYQEAVKEALIVMWEAAKKEVKK